MAKRNTFDFWYAVNNTEIVVLPKRHLETFGSTSLQYHLVAELMDTTEQVRIREGRMLASQPEIITPEAYSSVFLEGFGEEAGRYMQWLKEHESEVRILQYGYRLKQESFSEHIVTDNVEAVVKRVEKEVKEKDDPNAAVVKGVDDPWDVCLVRLFWEIVQGSAKTNIQQLQKRRLFEDMGGLPKGVRDQLEKDFLAASKNPSLINGLGRKLQNYGVFEEYQDRFFALVKASKRQ